MKNNKTGLFILICSVFFLVNCSDRPSNVLSDKKMEDVIYDLYLAEAVKDRNYAMFNNDSARKQQLANDVFKKNKIKERDFDSSLEWYAGNLERYLKILDRVSERYNQSIEHLSKEQESAPSIHIPSRDNLIDTTYFVLQTPLFDNRFVFNLEDINLSQVRNYQIDFDVLGVSETTKPTLYFNIYTTSTVHRHQERIEGDGHFSRTYTLPNSEKPVRIYGYIEIPDSQKSFVLFRNFVVSKDKDEQIELKTERGRILNR